MEPNKPEIDHILNNFINKELIGTGSNGNRVYKVLNKKDNKIYAMKKILINQTEEERYKNEIKILKSLNHSNIIKFYDSFIRKDKLYIIMEYAEKGDLKSVIKKRIMKDYESIEEDKIWKWFSQIALAVKYLHSKKIIHRDIKVENVFITNQDDVKLGDFGISKELETSMDLANSGVGTPYYLSPEICQGLKYNFKTDIWMMGCLLYEICTLKKPFKADSIKVLIKSIVTKDPDEIVGSHYSDNLLKLINLMLKKHPEERPTIGEVMVRIHMSTKLNLPIKIDKNKLKIEVEEEILENGELTFAEKLEINKISQSERKNGNYTPISSIQIDFKNKKLENDLRIKCNKFTPVYCKKDITKIMQNMQISPISNNDAILIENSKRRTSSTTTHSTPTNVIKNENINSCSNNKIVKVENINSEQLNKNIRNRHYRHISINISSTQSPEHKAIYHIDNIEKIEFPSPILNPQSLSNRKCSNRTKQIMTPTNLIQMKKISPKEKLMPKDIPNTTKAEDSLVRKSLIKNFLIERYTKEKFELMYNKIMQGNKINENWIKEIVGEDYKVAINYLKYLTGKK